jgi:predicted DNA-binding transcriptional regulator YafY
VKAERLLSTLLLLQAHGRLTGRQLAERLEVSVRTVHRDMESLSAAGVPVFAERGARGGWSLAEGWRTRVPGLAEDELRALLMAQPRVVGDSRLARAAERALEKLMAALPGTLREQASSMRQRLHVDTTGWSGTAEDLSMLPAVQDAVARDRRLEIRYRRPGAEPRDRAVDPLGLVSKGGAWYLVAATADGLRTFRVSRIESARILEHGFERPRGFDLAVYWKSSTEELARARGRYPVTLRLDAEAAALFQKWGRLPGARTAGDRVTLTTQFDDEAQATFVVLGLGARAEVIRPASLRSRVLEEHAAAVERARSPRRGRSRGG